jgi:hypothetical protein
LLLEARRRRSCLSDLPTLVWSAVNWPALPRPTYRFSPFLGWMSSRFLAAILGASCGEDERGTMPPARSSCGGPSAWL